MKLNILYQFNDNYVPYAGVSLFSLLENNKEVDSIQIYILGEKLSAANKSEFYHLAERYGRTISILDATQAIMIMREIGIPPYRGAYATNLKLFFPLFIKDDIQNLLYIDSDTLVLDNLEELFSQANSNFPVGMVLDSLAVKHKSIIGFTRRDFYFNAGVILFNVPLWKEQKCTEEIVMYACSNRAHFISPDQDLLNIVLKGKIQKLDVKYNFQPIHYRYSPQLYNFFWRQPSYYTIDQIDVSLNKPVIIHFFRFLGEFPWNLFSLHPYTELFNSYLEKSPWKMMERMPSNQQSLIFYIERKLYKLLPDFLFMFIFRISYDLFIHKAERKSRKKQIYKDM